MSVVTISVLLLVIGGFIVFAIVMQLKEKARLDKLRKIATLNNQLRQVQRYIDEMPPQYQPKDMRLWLYSRMISIYDQLIQLQPDPTLTRRRGNVAEEMSEFQGDKKKRRARPMNDEVLILEVKRLFDSFKSFLVMSKREKTISSDVVSRYNSLLDFYMHKVTADYHAYLARQAFLSGQMETAVTFYKEALSQLAPVKDLPEAKSTILKYTDLMEEIQSDLELQKAEEELLNSSDDDDNEEEGLDDEWNQFMEDSSFKEKKKF